MVLPLDATPAQVATAREALTFRDVLSETNENTEMDRTNSHALSGIKDN